ncbi:3597_t:CDS:2 [Scutellospora calospora]|uniref:3597_t:CDS:1 n=1 Tax=Scutellospora calospora TaxID=85575 RepID=A0ACA9LNA5_9GLOM|nr:3597_t:CDS:2 [Scutellospora calospora]
MTLTTYGPIFHKSTATTTNSHTAAYIAKGIQEVILEFGENFINSVVTDNAMNMRAAWNILRIEFPSILFYGCAAHSTNLIISDIFKKSQSVFDENNLQLQWAHNVLEIANKITNYFNSRQIVKAYLHETQKQEINKTIRLVNSVKTRWGTQLAVLEKLLESKRSIQSVLGNNKLPIQTLQDRQIRVLIADEDNWDNISTLAEVLHPISDSATLSLVYKEMVDMENLQRTIISPIQDSVIAIIVRRFDYMKNSIMQLAYLLDSRFYPYNNFQPTVHELTQLFYEVIPYISNFISKSENEIHAELYKEYGELVTLLNNNISLQEVAKELHPRDWWSAYGFGFQLLQLFCTRVFAMPISSASSERNWSAFSHIHTKKRNRLTNERLEELVYIYWNLRVIYKDNNKKEGNINNGSDIEQEIDNYETNNLSDNEESDYFWEDFDELTDQA